MIHLNPYSSSSGHEMRHYSSITDSDLPPGGVPLSTAGHDEMSEAENFDQQKDRNAMKNQALNNQNSQQACCGGGCLIF